MVRRGFPGRVDVAGPFDKILQAGVSSFPGIEDFFDRVLFFLFNDDGWRRWWYLPRNGIVCGGVQQCYVKDGVYLHAPGKVDSVGIWGYNRFDGERTEFLPV